MRVLHLCGDFPNQRLYVHLVAGLAEAGVSQVVYAAVRSEAEASWKAAELARIPCHMRHILSRRHRILFRTKISRITRDLSRTVNVADADMVHAHFLYSDGAVALRLRRELGIPFIAAVRNADLNFFMRYRPDLQWIRNDILREASRIVFLSPAYQAAMMADLPRSLAPEVEKKALVIPNGIGREWLSFMPGPERASADPLRLLHVGDLSPNKNLRNVLRAAELISASRSVRLTVVGGAAASPELLRTLRSAQYPFVDYVGQVDDQERLRDLYRSHDVFVMPSFTETFGLAYIEALSQGLPIVHSRGQGLDGYFSPGSVSEAVDPRDPVDIAGKVETLSRRLPDIRTRCVEESKRFDWPAIIRVYTQLYAGVLDDSAPARQ